MLGNRRGLNPVTLPGFDEVGKIGVHFEHEFEMDWPGTVIEKFDLLRKSIADSARDPHDNVSVCLTFREAENIEIKVPGFWRGNKISER